MTATHRGYWFSGDKLRDGRPLPKVGRWLKHVGPIVPCKSGLHWSPTAWDALKYAPGNLLHIVEARGKTIQHGDPIDKYASRERRIVATIDATHLLRRFAADQALSVAHLWNMPNIVRAYLAELDESNREAALDAVRAAARSAARSAAWAAEQRAAARSAAWAAAWAAEQRAAARSAARAAARAAALAAARAAEQRAAAGVEFNARVDADFSEAAK